MAYKYLNKEASFGMSVLQAPAIGALSGAYYGSDRPLVSGAAGGTLATLAAPVGYAGGGTLGFLTGLALGKPGLAKKLTGVGALGGGVASSIGAGAAGARIAHGAGNVKDSIMYASDDPAGHIMRWVKDKYNSMGDDPPQRY